MSILKFDATSGGSVSMVATDSSAIYAINVPANNGILVLKDSATGAAYIASGTTAQRPANPVYGMIRYNSTLGYPEWYNGTSWVLL